MKDSVTSHVLWHTVHLKTITEGRMVESRLIKKVVFIPSDVGDPVQNVRGWPHGNLIKPVHTLKARFPNLTVVDPMLKIQVLWVKSLTNTEAVI